MTLDTLDLIQVLHKSPVYDSAGEIANVLYYVYIITWILSGFVVTSVCLDRLTRKTRKRFRKLKLKRRKSLSRLELHCDKIRIKSFRRINE